MTIPSITRTELHERLGSVVLIEALPQTQYAAEHIPTALNVPGPLTPEIAQTLAPDLNQAIVVYCSGQSCTRSRATAIAFIKLGYSNVAVYEGGKADWFEAGLPMEQTTSAA